MNIRPLHTLSPAEIRDLAHQAAERYEPLATANPFDVDTERHKQFAAAYRQHAHDLQLDLCT